MRKWRASTQFDRDHKAGRWKRQDSNSGILVPGSVILTTTLQRGKGKWSQVNAPPWEFHLIEICLARQALYHVLATCLVFYLCYVNSSYPQYYMGSIITLFYKTQNCGIGNRKVMTCASTHTSRKWWNHLCWFCWDYHFETTVITLWTAIAGGSHYWEENRTTFQASRQEVLSLWCRAMYVTEASGTLFP